MRTSLSSTAGSESPALPNTPRLIIRFPVSLFRMLGLCFAAVHHASRSPRGLCRACFAACQRASIPPRDSVAQVGTALRAVRSQTDMRSLRAQLRPDDFPPTVSNGGDSNRRPTQSSGLPLSPAVCPVHAPSGPRVLDECLPGPLINRSTGQLVCPTPTPIPTPTPLSTFALLHVCTSSPPCPP